MSAPATALTGAEVAGNTHESTGATSDVETVFDRCGRSLYRYVIVRTGGDAHLADDVMQHVWIQAIRGGRSVPLDKLEYWLRRVAANALRAHWRKQRNRPAHLPLADPALAGHLARQLDSESLPAETLDRREVRDQILLALTKLPCSEQELIVGRYFRDQSVTQLAESLGISVRAVEGRLYRARQALRETLLQLER